MKYMLLMNYAPVPGVPPITEWAPEDIKASGAHMGAIHEELTASGELVGAEGTMPNARGSPGRTMNRARCAPFISVRSSVCAWDPRTRARCSREPGREGRPLGHEPWRDPG
jgi:hypothetical protein